jgi:hypothetical protein
MRRAMARSERTPGVAEATAAEMTEARRREER